jgi:hypothetical protein
LRSVGGIFDRQGCCCGRQRFHARIAVMLAALAVWPTALTLFLRTTAIA